jgi:hypothetical protein
MEKKAIDIGNSVSISGLTIVPVVEVRLNSWCGRRGVSYFGTKQPVAVVIASPPANRAFRITGEEISIDQLQQEAPELTGILEDIGAC